MFTEKALIENYIVKQLQERGWEFVPTDELKREGYKEPLLIQNLIRAIERINKDLFRLAMTPSPVIASAASRYAHAKQSHFPHE